MHLPKNSDNGDYMELGSNFGMDLSQIKYQEENIQRYLADENVIYYDSGRSAIKDLISILKNGKILLPSYLCKSVVSCFQDFMIEYYLVNEQFEINIESLESKLDEAVTAVYIMHYFGVLQKAEVLNRIKQRQQEFHYIIIEDTTHSFLTEKSTIGDYHICSLRKWFAIPDGGILYSRKPFMPDNTCRECNPNSARILEAMLLKQMYIEKKANTNALYRRMFTQQEENLDRQESVYSISEISSVILECTNLNTVIRQRKRNWNYINKNLRNPYVLPVFCEIGDDTVPFAFLIKTESKDMFRDYMAENKIYCAFHWPVETEEQQKIPENQKLQKHILSLPIDQRYGQEEMEYMVRVINSYRQ